MITAIVSAVVALLSCVGGMYLGYKYGRKVEAGVQTVIAAAQASIQKPK